MGTWGEGNFQNDRALDYLGDVIDHLRENVDALIDSEDGDLDAQGESVLMPSVELIALLCEHSAGVPPRVEVIESWRQRYLARYDAQIDGLRPQGDFKQQRRAVIDQTFTRIAEQARKFWRDDP